MDKKMFRKIKVFRNRSPFMIEIIRLNKEVVIMYMPENLVSIMYCCDLNITSEIIEAYIKIIKPITNVTMETIVMEVEM